MALDIREIDYRNELEASHLRALLSEYACDPSVGGIGMDADVLRELPEKLAQFPTASSFVGYVDGEPAALANCFLGFSTFAGRPLLNIHDVIVSKAFRGQGLCRKMLGHIEKKARESGCCKLTLEVLEGNTVAKHAYENFGFATYSLSPEYGVALFFEKKLTD